MVQKVLRQMALRADDLEVSLDDFSSLGELGVRTTLDPSIDAVLVRPAPPVMVKRGLFRREKLDEDAPTEVTVPILIYEYSVTAIGFAVPEDETLDADALWAVRCQGNDTQVRVVGPHLVDGLEAWEAIFTESRPMLLRTIDEGVLHLDVAGEEAHWNALRD